MDNNKMNKILEDLYEVDPELKTQEKELKEIIKKLLASKPEVKIDQKFVKDLREKLLEGEKKQVTFKLKYMNKFIYAGIGMAVMALILIPFYNNRDTDLGFDRLAQNSGVQIENVDEKAFGSLENIASNNMSTKDGDINGNAGILGMGSAESASGGDSVSSRIMPMPPRVSYEFEYVGDDIEIEKDKTSVIQRSAGGDILASQLLSFDRLNIGDIDYNNFDALKFNNITLYEDSDSGYMLTINSNEEKVAIYKNWKTWPREDGLNDRLEMSDIPSDDVIINIAKQFVEDYGIDLSAYKEPVVDKQWFSNYERSENKEMFYIPQTMTVTYPLVLEGKEVYTQYSDKYGLQVQVDVRNNHVNSVNEIVNHNYKSSDYKVVQEESRIIDIAERGGYRNYSYNREDDNVEKATVQLGTPSLKLVRLWKHNPSEDESQELYVEAYIFPVVGGDDSFYRDYVVVPIVEDLVSEDERQNNNLPDVSEPYIGIPEGAGSTPIIEPRGEELPRIQEDQDTNDNLEIQILN
jgi:hypothetical protein